MPVFNINQDLSLLFRILPREVIISLSGWLARRLLFPCQEKTSQNGYTHMYSPLPISHVIFGNQAKFSVFVLDENLKSKNLRRCNFLCNLLLCFFLFSFSPNRPKSVSCHHHHPRSHGVGVNILAYQFDCGLV